MLLSEFTLFQGSQAPRLQGKPCRPNGTVLQIKLRGLLPRGYGLLDSVLARDAEGPGSIPATSKCYVVQGGRVKPDTINLRDLAIPNCRK